MFCWSWAGGPVFIVRTLLPPHDWMQNLPNDEHNAFFYFLFYTYLSQENSFKKIMDGSRVIKTRI